MLTAIKRRVPASWKEWIKARAGRSSRLYCPICDQHAAEFQTFGVIPPRNARRPKCGALERHCFVWMFFQRKTALLDGQPKRLLHFAPERWIADHVRKVENLEYVTADLFDPNASIKVDITSMP